MHDLSRRRFLGIAGTSILGAGLAEYVTGAQPPLPLVPRPETVEVLMPRNRVPLSVIIDDSTCLVNMGHFCTPQFAAAHPDREVYRKDWRKWPREIPDAFVREFGHWCAEQGVKGKYSVVPYPACVGRLDRELPGWSHRQLLDSLSLVRDLMMPNWDIHPEMITHTRVIDLTTGHPFAEIGSATMENSYPQTPVSVDHLTAYLAYALRILRNCGLECEGITTPGGFGNLVKSELSLAVHEAVRDVFGAEIPHYFKYVRSGEEDTQPVLEHVRGAGTNDVRVTVNVPAGTGDWFGGWQGDTAPQGDLYATANARKGRMVELIERGSPALMLFHWPGMYCNGTRAGFRQFQTVISALNTRYRDRTIWMKLGEIARYWAAKELTQVNVAREAVRLDAPFAAPDFTMRLPALRPGASPIHDGKRLRQVSRVEQLVAGTWLAEDDGATFCFDLPRGESVLRLTAEAT